MTTDFVKLANEEIDECTDLQSLFTSSRIIYGMRNFAGVREYCVPKWRDKARRLIPSWETQKVVAVDLNSIFHEAYAVEPDDATGLCLGMLRKVYKDLSPSVFSVCVDSRSGVDKKLSNSGYKRSRSRSPDGFYEQLDATIATLRPKVRIEEHHGLEADDCLNTIAFQTSLLGSKCLLVANDRDLWQSLYHGVAMYIRKTGEFRNAEWLYANHRITRQQAVDWLVMVGKNDLPKVDGVGEATASDWLQAYGDFISAMDVSGNTKMKEFLTEHYFKVRECHTLSTGVPVQWFLDVKCNS